MAHIITREKTGKHRKKHKKKEEKEEIIHEHKETPKIKYFCGGGRIYMFLHNVHLKKKQTVGGFWSFHPAGTTFRGTGHRCG